MSYTAHVDTFSYQNLPPREQWPKLIFDLPELQYPERINCGTELLDRAIDRGWSERTAILAPDGLRWTYRELREKANRIARVLVDDLGSFPATACFCEDPNRCWRHAGLRCIRRAVSRSPRCRCCAPRR